VGRCVCHERACDYLGRLDGSHRLGRAVRAERLRYAGRLACGRGFGDRKEFRYYQLDTDSRAVAAGEAYERARLAALQVARMGFKHVYKKLDSTLRGNLGAEIDAVADAIPVDCIIVAPAYPKIGRTTRNGIHYVKDVRIDRTETAKDPKSPVAEADLVKLLASQSQRQAGLLPLEALRAGPEAASLRIGKLLRSGIEIIVCDAVSDEDLRRIADVAAAGVGRMLWAGSAGLAECLPDSLALARGRGAHEHLSRVVPERGKPVLLVAGSISKITRSQVAAFNQCPRTKAVELDAIFGNDFRRRLRPGARAVQLGRPDGACGRL